MNKLTNSTSPYLLQHANNPVDWHQWDEESLLRARTENKPIFLSIGYAACHWCHVMAHESFEDPETAAFMNEHFINIKVDREERPDLDSIYMQATQAMTGSGGWPMSVFLTPDLRPFYAGTYFPPVRRHNMPSFKEILISLAKLWREDREEVNRVGDQVFQHIQQQIQVNQKSNTFTRQMLEAIAKSLLEAYDWGYGGWGSAPKFPQSMTIEFLLHRASLNSTQSQQILKAASHALNAMARGGVYDVVGGGFARYSTDNFWRVPHFEKMLYDNALLARAYLHAWQITGEPSFKRVVKETLDFVAREMTHPDGGFYSSLDADSEGEEGKFYIWTLEEIRETLKADMEFFEAAYGITIKGNWEGKTVLQRALDDSSLAARFKLDPRDVPGKLTACHSRLLSARASRVRPATDDKVLTAWNGLMLGVMAEAAQVFPDKELRDKYLLLATRNSEFLLDALHTNGRLHRSWRDGKVTNDVFLEDYAALILGLLELYQTDFKDKWFKSAVELAAEMIARFEDPNGGFFDTPKDGEGLPIRPKDMQDNATPSGNALACEALLKLYAFTDKGEYRDRAEKSLMLVMEYALRYPAASAHWLSAAELALGSIKQVAVVGEAQDESFAAMMRLIRSAYRPNTVIAASSYPPSQDAPALLIDRPMKDGKATAYVCEGFVCKQPVTVADELQKQL